MAGYWRGSGGADDPGEADRPERITRQPERQRAYGDFDPDKISDEELLSYFGYDNWDDWKADQQPTNSSISTLANARPPPTGTKYLRS